MHVKCDWRNEIQEECVFFWACNLGRCPFVWWTLFVIKSCARWKKKPTYIHTYMYLLNTDKSRPIKSHGQRSVFQLALRSLDQFAYFGCLILRKIAQVTGDTGNYFNLAAKWLSSTLNPVWRLLTSLGYIFYYCIYVCTFSFEPLVAGDKSQVFSDF